MASLEIHPLSGLRDEAATLLAERYARQRAAEPLLPEVDDFEAHLPADGARRDARRTGGRLPRRGGRRRDEDGAVALRGPRRARAGGAARPVRAPGGGVRRVALHAHRAGHRPGADRRVVPARVRLPGGLGGARGRAGRAGRLRRDDPAARRRTTWKRSIDFDELLYEHQAATPSFSGVRRRRRASSSGRSAARSGTAPRPTSPFVAERDGRVVGHAAASTGVPTATCACPRTTSTSRSPRPATTCAAPAPGSR